MKTRIGFAAGAQTAEHPEQFGPLVDELEQLGYDSIWLPEVFTAPTLDPLAALGFVAGRTTRLKIGTHLIAPGRNPVRLAKSLATLDRLSGGRLLLTFVLGLPDDIELAAQGVPKNERVERLEETLTLVRRLWSETEISYRGTFLRYEGPGIVPQPAQRPLEVWMGGMVPSSLRRVGRLADGWIPGLCTPHQAAAAKEIIDRAATEAGRKIDVEHFGVNVTYAEAPLDPTTEATLARRFRNQPVSELVPTSLDALRARLEEFIQEGFSKFVIRPAAAPPSWPEHLRRTADAVLDLHQ